MMRKQRHTTARSVALAARGPMAVMAALACVGPEITLAAPAASPKQAGNVTIQRLFHADAEPGEWMTGGRDYKQSYYSPLAQINSTNISKLGFSWNRDIGPTAPVARGTPIVVDGVMYVSGSTNVYALDASDGNVLWKFPAPGTDNSDGGSSWGVSVASGKVYLLTSKGILYAIGAADGSIVWKVDTIADHSRTYVGSGAPCIAGDVVVVGNAGGEFDARGYVTAYDLETGRQRWRFYVVPGNPSNGFEHPELELAAKTWDPNSRWDLGGGGTVWDGMTYDPELKLIYVGTGNGLPWSRSLRSPSGGDNLFLASIVAIHADTGTMAWYYQNTPADNWDYDAVQKIVLADLSINGQARKVLMQAPKNGFFYVIDRKTGVLISARPYTYVNWASEVDAKTGRPHESPDADYSKAPKLVFPSDWGAHNWQPMAFNPATGLVYIPVLQSATLFGPTTVPLVYHKQEWNIGVFDFDIGEMTAENLPRGWPPLADLLAGKPDPTPRTYLRAWDPVRQSKVWEAETTNSRLSDFGNLSGVISTAGGLVIQGEADGHLRVFDAWNGHELRNITTGLATRAAPITYRVHGEQYIALITTPDSGGEDSAAAFPGQVLAFKLGGGEIPRSLLAIAAVKAPPVPNSTTPEEITRGGQLYAGHCSVCHASGGRAPDLSQLNAAAHREFMDIVLKGARSSKGMPNFGSTLSADDAKALHAYVTDVAWKNYEQSRASSRAEGRELQRAGSSCPVLRTVDHPVHVLLVTGGHPFEASEFFAFFSTMPGVRFQHVLMENGGPAAVPPGGLGQYDAVVFYDLEEDPATITPGWRSVFERGHGIVFLHHSLGDFPGSPEFVKISGGRYKDADPKHPEIAPSTFHPNEMQHFKIVDTKHPITCALSDFEMLDEAYDNLLVAPDVHVLMTSDVPKETPAAAWISSYTQKRVVYIQPGHGSYDLPLDHGPSAYQNDHFKELVQRAIFWVAGRM